MDPVTENERGELLLALEHVEVKVEPEDDPGSGPKGEESLAASVGTSHQDAMAKLKEGLAEALQDDPLLCDLPPAVTLEEVNSQIALEYGQAMTVNVHREDGIVLPVVVVASATVLELKKAIRRYMTLKLKRQGNTATLSWRYIWRRYALIFEGQKLEEEKKPIKEYGIRNRDKVTFIRKLRPK